MTQDEEDDLENGWIKIALVSMAKQVKKERAELKKNNPQLYAETMEIEQRIKRRLKKELKSRKKLPKNFKLT